MEKIFIKTMEVTNDIPLPERLLRGAFGAPVASSALHSG